MPIQTHPPPQHIILDYHRYHGTIITIINNISSNNNIRDLDHNPDHNPSQRIEYLLIICTALRRVLWIKQHSLILIRICPTFRGLVNIIFIHCLTLMPSNININHSHLLAIHIPLISTHFQIPNISHRVVTADHDIATIQSVVMLATDKEGAAGVEVEIVTDVDNVGQVWIVLKLGRNQLRLLD